MSGSLKSYYKRLATLREKRDILNDDINRVMGYIAQLESLHGNARSESAKPGDSSLEKAGDRPPAPKLPPRR